MSIKQSTYHTLAMSPARLRLVRVPRRPFRLGETSLMLVAVVMICVISILFLAQTGRVVTSGYQLQELEREHAQLLREAEQYQYRIAKANQLDQVAERAHELGLREAKGEQLRYATIELRAVPVVASNIDR